MSTRVIDFPIRKGRKVRGTDITAGQILFAVYHVESRRYFAWSYTDRATAEIIAGRVRNGPTNPTDAACNWRDCANDTTPTDTKIKSHSAKT